MYLRSHGLRSQTNVTFFFLKSLRGTPMPGFASPNVFIEMHSFSQMYDLPAIGPRKKLGLACSYVENIYSCNLPVMIPSYFHLYSPSPFQISMSTPPGTKVRLRGSLVLRSGFLLLEPQHLEVLGGRVEALVDKWEISREGRTNTISCTKRGCFRLNYVCFVKLLVSWELGTLVISPLKTRNSI